MIERQRKRNHSIYEPNQNPDSLTGHESAAHTQFILSLTVKWMVLCCKFAVNLRITKCKQMSFAQLMPTVY